MFLPLPVRFYSEEFFAFRSDITCCMQKSLLIGLLCGVGADGGRRHTGAGAAFHDTCHRQIMTVHIHVFLPAVLYLNHEHVTCY